MGVGAEGLGDETDRPRSGCTRVASKLSSRMDMSISWSKERVVSLQASSLRTQTAPLVIDQGPVVSSRASGQGPELWGPVRSSSPALDGTDIQLGPKMAGELWVVVPCRVCIFHTTLAHSRALPEKQEMRAFTLSPPEVAG
jgi:hypothetical protein